MPDVDDGEMPDRFDSLNAEGTGTPRFNVPLRDQLLAQLSYQRSIRGGRSSSAFKIIEKAVGADSEDEAADVIVDAIADCREDARRWDVDESSSQELQDLYQALDGDEPTRQAILADAEAEFNRRDLAATHDADRWPGSSSGDT